MPHGTDGGMDIHVAFEGTLCPDGPDREPRSAPEPGAAGSLARLQAAGHRITVCSTRAAGAMPGGWKARAAERLVRGWLRRHAIPFDRIEVGRPGCDLLVDRRAVAHDGDWSRLAELVPGAARR